MVHSGFDFKGFVGYQPTKLGSSKLKTMAGLAIDADASVWAGLNIHSASLTRFLATGDSDGAAPSLLPLHKGLRWRV